ncbi:MAG: hypothetical protein EAZ57_01900 [Cytophagales bacterium]|nr:MAG: hypothetical protein EAZ67_02690 [Cytophagales bacterium]TAF61877.1 MAG: hypothetical protein EAZ57_01900 [Cytophagales bacterium]
MFDFLKNHLFGVEAFFERSLVLTYALPQEQLATLIPPCLTLDTFQDKWAFVAVAMVQTKGLRPKGFPAFMGNDFFLIGYRVFVRYQSQTGRNLRGLYILKSETDKPKMQLMGNTFTHYDYSTTDITQQANEPYLEVSSQKSKLSIKVNLAEEATNLPSASPFDSWKEARRFAGPMPFTFTYLPQKKQVILIEGVRQNWRPRAVEVINHEVGFLEQRGFANAQLANAFVIENVPYFWKKGRIELWKSL